MEKLTVLTNRYKESNEGFLRLLEETRVHPDKKYLLTSFRQLLIDQWYINNDKKSSYVDSVLFYINKVSDPEEIGFAYFDLGVYYGNFRDVSTAHLYYYKAIPYLEQSPADRHLLAQIYYNLSAAYNEINDYDNLGKMVEKLF